MAAEPLPALPRRLFRWWHAVVVVGFVVFYLVPIAYVGAMKSDVRSLPMYLRHIQRIACLFTHSVGSWRSYHVQMQEAGSNEWEEVTHLDAFQLQIFGYRTRTHRILGHAYKKSRGRRRTKELAAFFKEKLEAGEGPSGQPREVAAIRFVRAWHPVRELAEEEGRYVMPPLEDIPKKRWQIFGEHRYDGRRPRHR